MAVFVIGQMKIHKRDWMEAYFAEIPDVVAEHGGRFVVRGAAPARLEGERELPDAAFILEFPDRARADAFWRSAAFQDLAVLRRSGSTLDAILVDGLD